MRIRQVTGRIQRVFQNSSAKQEKPRPLAAELPACLFFPLGWLPKGRQRGFAAPQTPRERSGGGEASSVQDDGPASLPDTPSGTKKKETSRGQAI